MNASARHILVEFYDCSPELMNDVVHIENSGFSYSSKGEPHPLHYDRKSAALFSSEQGFKYDNEDVHVAALALPKYVKELMLKAPENTI